MRCEEKKKIASRRIARKLLRKLSCERPREDIPLKDYRCSNCYAVHLGHDYMQIHPRHHEIPVAILSFLDIGIGIHEELIVSSNGHYYIADIAA